VKSDGHLYLNSWNSDNTNSYDIRFGAGPDWGMERFGNGFQFFKINHNNGGETYDNHRLFLHDNGNVAIGNNNPCTKLDVSGSVFIPYGQSYWIGSYSDNNNRLRMHCTESIGAYIDYYPNMSIRRGTDLTTVMFVSKIGFIGMGGNTNPQYPLDVAGILRVNSTTYISDKRMKTNIKKSASPVDSLLNLTAYSYNMLTPQQTKSLFKKREASDDTVTATMGNDSAFYTRRHTGFIAQEVKKTFPEMVYEDANGLLSIDYISFIPLIIEGMKRQQSTIWELEDSVKSSNAGNVNLQEQITALKAELQALKAAQTACCQSNSGRGKLKSGSEEDATSSSTTGTTTTVDGQTAATLGQNAPNPFGSETTIGMYLPSTVQRASLRVYDLTGKQLKAITVSGRGNTSVTINGRELPAGMYHYVLVADGQLVGTREMILTE